MSKDPFEMYKLPLGLTEGVDIALEGTSATFRVRLPATSDEDFHMELMSRLQVNVDKSGQIKIDATKFQSERKKMFFDTCILSATGLPKGMTHAEFFKAYPLAAKAVFDRATDLAAKVDEEIETTLGKSVTLPNGKISGEVDTSNMKTSSKRESRSKLAAQN